MVHKVTQVFRDGNLVHKVTHVLTVKQFAERVGWAESTVRKKILNREIDYIKISRSVRIPIEVADRMLSSGYRAALSTTEPQR